MKQKIEENLNSFKNQSVCKSGEIAKKATPVTCAIISSNIFLDYRFQYQKDGGMVVKTPKHIYIGCISLVHLSQPTKTLFSNYF